VAAEFAFHGDMNNRFLIYTNRQDFLVSEQQGEINDDNFSETYGELKYRFWFEAASNDGDVRGVYAIEIGGIRFGEDNQGGAFSGDDENVETRWAYLDFQTPGVESKSRWLMGLQPVSVNDFLWQETAAGVIYNGAPNDALSYQVGWIRGFDELNTDGLTPRVRDHENYILRLNWNMNPDTLFGFFGLIQTGDFGAGEVNPRQYLVKSFADDVDMSIWTIGLDGGTKFGDWFLNWDLMYQGGSFDNVTFNDSEFSGVTNTRDYDLGAYFAGIEGGVKLGKNKFTGTFWYASGDDNPNDGDFDGFLATDLDRADNISIFEGLYTDDSTYFTERPYILDKGFMMIKGAVDHQFSEKFSFGGALMYMMTAEDIEYSNAAGTQNFSNSDVGFEVNAYMKYMLYSNVEFALNAGYLFAGDALDAFEVDAIRDGSSDENVFGSSMRIRYKF
jgi:hypothetical protein